MRILRTPDSFFEGLPDFPWAPHYTMIRDDDGTDIRIAHVEAGDPHGKPLLLLHGNPTWSFLYRRMIPLLEGTGRRLIAVDLVGCGRSDKPADKADYTLARHYDWMGRWLETHDLRNAALFAQDWGGTIGLALVSRYPDRFSHVIASNTGVPLGEGESDFMRMWVGMMREAQAFPWMMLEQGMTRKLSAAELAAYRAPFPDPSYEAGIISFPLLITVQPDNPGLPLNLEVWRRLQAFERPFLTLFGEKDPVARGWEKRAQAAIPGASGQPHAVIEDAHHFIQEDAPEELCRRISEFLDIA
jgi:haloalkane dehalogenase